MLHFERFYLVFKQPSVNLINVKRARFTYERLFSSYVLALNKVLYEKFTLLTLMKLTAGYVLANPGYAVNACLNGIRPGANPIKEI